MRGYQTLVSVKERGTLPSRDKSFIKLCRDLKQFYPIYLFQSFFFMLQLPVFRKQHKADSQNKK